VKDKTPLPAETAAVNMETEDLDLRSLRESKGITLRDIFSATRITTINLEAIEAGRYQALPEPVYTRTFIREYARFLDIDSGPLLRKYENYLDSLHASTAQLPRRQQELSPTGEKKKLILSAVLIILLILLIAVLLLFESSDRRDLTSSRPPNPPPTDTGKGAVPPPIPTAAPALPTSAPAAPPPAKTTPVPAAPVQLPAPPGPAVNLQIAATERTWVRLTADRERPEQLIMEKGDKMERKARESFLLDVGNAGGVLVWFQGQPLPPLGRRGEVKHLKLP